MSVHTRQIAIDFAEQPYVKATARAAMLFTTLVAVPVVAWVINTTMQVNQTLGGMVLIQQAQGKQVDTLTQTQTKLLDVAATEAQSRSSQTATLSAQVDNLKELANRIDEHVGHLDDRINAMYQQNYTNSKR